MSYVDIAKYDEVSPAARAIWDEQVKAHGRMTNMKMTLAHDADALAALMTWYPLWDRIVTFVGKRPASLYAHAVSSASDCLICSTFFRRILREAGENPDALTMNELERLLVELGRAIAKDSLNVDRKIMEACRARFSDGEMVALVTFGAVMLATNVFNNVMDVDLDDYLEPYRGLLPKGQ